MSGCETTTTSAAAAVVGACARAKELLCFPEEARVVTSRPAAAAAVVAPPPPPPPLQLPPLSLPLPPPRPPLPPQSASTHDKCIAAMSKLSARSASLQYPSSTAVLTRAARRLSDKAAAGFSATAAATQAAESRRCWKSFVFEGWLLPQKRHECALPPHVGAIVGISLRPSLVQGAISTKKSRPVG